MRSLSLGVIYILRLLIDVSQYDLVFKKLQIFFSLPV
jgi:hypothetical protein